MDLIKTLKTGLAQAVTAGLTVLAEVTVESDIVIRISHTPANGININITKDPIT